VSLSKLSFCGCAVKCAGHFWCCKKVFVALSSNRDLILVVPLMMLVAKSVKLSYCKRLDSGCIVKGVPWAIANVVGKMKEDFVLCSLHH